MQKQWPSLSFSITSKKYRSFINVVFTKVTVHGFSGAMFERRVTMLLADLAAVKRSVSLAVIITYLSSYHRPHARTRPGCLIVRYSLQTTLTCIYMSVWCQSVFVTIYIRIPPLPPHSRCSKTVYLIIILTTLRIRHLPLGSCHYFKKKRLWLVYLITLILGVYTFKKSIILYYISSI